MWFLSVSFPWNNWMWRNIILFWIQMFGFESFHVYFLSLALAATGCCMQIGKQCWTSWKSLWNFRLHTRQDLWRLICRSNQIAFHSSCHRIQKSPIINAANPPVSKVFGLDDILSPGLRAWRMLDYIYKYSKAVCSKYQMIFWIWTRSNWARKVDMVAEMVADIEVDMVLLG